MLWPLLITALEDGLANDEWDGDRQRAYSVEARDRPHLARQMLAVREELVSQGRASIEELPDPTDGFDSFL